MIGAHQQIRGGLAGRIGRIRRVGRGFREKTRWAKRAINLIRGHMMEPAAFKSPIPKTAAGFQQIERPHNVGGDEIARTG